MQPTPPPDPGKARDTALLTYLLSCYDIWSASPESGRCGCESGPAAWAREP